MEEPVTAIVLVRNVSTDVLWCPTDQWKPPVRFVVSYEGKEMVPARPGVPLKGGSIKPIRIEANSQLRSTERLDHTFKLEKPGRYFVTAILSVDDVEAQTQNAMIELADGATPAQTQEPEPVGAWKAEDLAPSSGELGYDPSKPPTWLPIPPELQRQMQKAEVSRIQIHQETGKLKTVESVPPPAPSLAAQGVPSAGPKWRVRDTVFAFLVLFLLAVIGLLIFRKVVAQRRT
jgi:hypothetical protein